MPSEGIEGDEWGAYVTLSRIAGTNAGSPNGREPYGDTGPVVVAGVTTCQGGGNTVPQGKGGQAMDISEQGGTRNAERRDRLSPPGIAGLLPAPSPGNRHLPSEAGR